MKKYNSVSIMVTNDESSYGDIGNLSIKTVIDKWEDFLVDRFGLEINQTGGKSMYYSFEIVDSPSDFNEEEFRKDMEEAWEDFCNNDFGL